MKIYQSSLEFSHFPVMLSEILEISSPAQGGVFVDCTLGGGGYSQAILKFPETKVIGIDRDSDVISVAKKIKKKFQERFIFHNLKFSQIDSILKYNVDTIIFDLGLSSIQLKNFKRGFSFKSKERLDMTMGLSDFSAQDVINNLSETQLNLIIRILGEEKESKK